MDCIASNGGPLICVPKSALALWRGGDALGEHSQEAVAYRHDYDRACAIRDYLGVVSIGRTAGIVLGDMPMETAVLTSTDGLPLIARIIHVGPSTDIPMLLEAGMNTHNSKRIESVELSIAEPDWHMFDSAYPGDWHDKDCLTVSFPVGVICVDTLEYRPDDHTFLIIHQFSRSRHDSTRPRT